MYMIRVIRNRFGKLENIKNLWNSFDSAKNICFSKQVNGKYMDILKVE